MRRRFNMGRKGGAFALLAAAGWCGLAVVAAAQSPPAIPAGTDRAQVEFFEREVRPVLVRECYSCHGEKVQQGGLRLDSRAAVEAGGAHGPAAEPKAPGRSLLVLAVKHQGRVMPPGRKLSARQIAALEKWVEMGMPWPGAQAAHRPQTWEEAFRLRRQRWSLQPVRRPVPPAVKAKWWSQDPVDRFILAELEKQGLKPVRTADRPTLIRRVYLTLIGLPPSPAEVDAFVADRSPRAYADMVDRVLASPHFGERWARHWMDVVRYGETHGYEWNYEIRDAWRYRDYLIRAFNQDVPYDQLIREHIAGDLLETPRIDRTLNLNESRTGTAFYRFGETGHDVFKEIGLDYLDGQIDTLSKAFQATTVSCARCHDHKLDAVSMKDYYGLLGVLASSRQTVVTLDTPEAHAGVKHRLAELKKEIRSELASLWQGEAGRFAGYLRAEAARRQNRPMMVDGLDEARQKLWEGALSAPSKGLDDPIHPWSQAAAPGADPAQVWPALAAAYAAEQKARADFNAANFQVLADFRTGSTAGWRLDGVGLREGPSPHGDFAVAIAGDRAVAGLYPAGLFTHLLSSRLNGTVVSPDWPAGKRFVSLEVLGDQQAVYRQVPDFRHIQDQGAEIKSQTLKWVRIGKSDRDERVYVELCTKLDNQRYECTNKSRNSLNDDPRSFFGITRAVAHDVGESPRADLAPVLPLLQGDAPRSLDEVADRTAGLFRGAVERWAAGKTGAADVVLLTWLLERNLLPNRHDASPRLAGLVAEYRKVEATVPAPRVVAGLADQGPEFSIDHPVYLRGDFRQVGDPVARRYLEVLGSSERFSAAGSGRLQLADRIADPRNPLTARVMVNRVWHWLFGQGLVRTVDDFGHMGEDPSHPLLLDYLASKFTDPAAKGGYDWSLKRLIRALVNTQVFKQSSQPDPRAEKLEPENRLLHHFPSRRAEAEVIRDSLLFVSGRLDPQLYGPSIHPYRPVEKGDRKLYGGPLDGDGRRSVYTRITLMETPPFLTVFNQPEAKVTQGRRDVTNVPAQALAMLNDPFVIQQSEVWAKRVMAEEDTTVEARLERMFRSALGRSAQPAEVERFRKATADLAALHQVPPDGVLRSLEVWKDIAHAVFNTKEFIYIR